MQSLFKEEDESPQALWIFSHHVLCFQHHQNNEIESCQKHKLGIRPIWRSHLEVKGLWGQMRFRDGEKGGAKILRHNLWHLSLGSSNWANNSLWLDVLFADLCNFFWKRWQKFLFAATVFQGRGIGCVEGDSTLFLGINGWYWNGSYLQLLGAGDRRQDQCCWQVLEIAFVKLVSYYNDNVCQLILWTCFLLFFKFAR